MTERNLQLLELTPERFQVTLAVRDIVDGFFSWTLWLTMAWFDIKTRYRRSVLGPFWLTISMGVLIGFMGLLYGSLLNIDLKEYLPFLTLGFLIWGFISGVIIDACNVFIASEYYIKQVRLPYTVFVYRVIMRNLLILAHNMAVYIVVAIYYGIWPGAMALLVVPGLALVLLNTVWVTTMLGIFCTRFRDIPQIVNSLVQVVFFMTPIMWTPSLMTKRPFVVAWNPFHHFIELFRAPLLGEAPAALSWEVCIALTIVGSAFSFVLFRRYRSRIAFWL